MLMLFWPVGETDVGNGKRLITDTERTLILLPWKKWLVSVGSDGSVMTRRPPSKMAKDTVKSMPSKIASLSVAKDKKHLRDWMLASQFRRQIEASSWDHPKRAFRCCPPSLTRTRGS